MNPLQTGEGGSKPPRNSFLLRRRSLSVFRMNPASQTDPQPSIPSVDQLCSVSKRARCEESRPKTHPVEIRIRIGRSCEGRIVVRGEGNGVDRQVMLMLRGRDDTGE